MTSSVVPMPMPQAQNTAAALTYPLGVSMPSILGMYAFAAATFIVGTRRSEAIASASRQDVCRAGSARRIAVQTEKPVVKGHFRASALLREPTPIGGRSSGLFRRFR
jgi:hypothetical protein